jgi:hypothetical protein
MRLLQEEADQYQDIVILDVSTDVVPLRYTWSLRCSPPLLQMEDNIDSGKTWKYYEWVAKEYGGEGRVNGRPRFVLLVFRYRSMTRETEIYSHFPHSRKADDDVSSRKAIVALSTFG